MRKIIVLFLILYVFVALNTYGQKVFSFTSSGSFTVPLGITTITVEGWGGGGGGGGASATTGSAGGGGGGGAYARSILTVIPGNTYTYVVGLGGVGGSGSGGNVASGSGGDTYFNNTTTLLAKGGSGGYTGASGIAGIGGVGGTSSASVGQVKYYGGNGASGSLNNYSGGGGASASRGSIGNDGSGSNGGSPIGSGGVYGAFGFSLSAAGSNGNNYGGGASGGLNLLSSALSGGNGGNGILIIYYDFPKINSFSPVSGPIGTTVIINGTGFSSTPSNNKVSFGGILATVNSSSSTAISVTVPSGAAYDKIRVQVVGGRSAVSAKPFNVTQPCTGKIVSAPTSFAAGVGLTSVATGDFNKDGIKDLAYSGGNNIYVRLGLGNGNFGVQSTLLGTNTIQEVVIGDFNLDGNQDLVGTNSGASVISIFTGTGLGAFSTKNDVATGLNPYNAVVADFNEDGIDDIAATNSGASTISILIGNGNGTFQAFTTTTVGTGPRGIDAGDIDNDGVVDLVVANYNGAAGTNFSILIGNGNGTFKTRVNRISISTGIKFVKIADLNSDGFNDIIVVCNTSSNIARNLGNGTTAPGTALLIANTSNIPNGIALADFNSDGNIDLAMTNTAATFLYIANGLGNGAFSTATSFNTTNGSNYVAIGDFDNDGNQDIVTSSNSDSDVKVLLNKCIPTVTNFSPTSGPAGTFVTVSGTNFSNILAKNKVTLGGITTTAISATANSLIFKVPNGATNGKIILNISNRIAESLATFDVTDPSPCGKNSFTSSSPSPYTVSSGAQGARWVASGDFNNDGFLDVVTPNQTNGNVSVLLGNGLGTFGAVTNFTVGTGPVSVVVGDFDSDGNQDMAVANYTGATVSVLLGSGSGTFTTSTTVSVSPSPYNIITADFNGDGILDLVTSDYAATGTLSILIGKGNGTFNGRVSYAAGSFPGFVAKGDFNFDGILDLVSANVSGNSLSILTGTGNGTFGAKQDKALGFSPRGVLVEDFNNDGKADIAVTDNTGGNVSIFLAAGGPLVYSGPVSYAVGANPWYLIAGDLDGDGQKDILTSSITASTVSFLRGSNTGTFTVSGTFAAGNGPYGLNIGDYNNDGKQDFSVANNTSNNLFAYINTCAVPEINSFTPTSGWVGTLVTITGNNLSFANGISIGGVPALIISISNTQVIGFVMPGATTGLITVSTPGGMVNSTTNFTITSTPYLCSQEGSKLVGTINSGASSQGNAIAVSADGHTAIVGGLGDNSNLGAAWIFTRSGSTWTQQGSKLVGTGSVGTLVYQGRSVSISADGNTAIMGGVGDNSNKGAVWVFTRNGSTWSQQGSKLVGTTTAVGFIGQGATVSISADGNTALVGGYGDNSSQGAAWIFTRTGSTWAQQGSKLVGTGSAGASVYQGQSVSISADGNTAIVGGINDNSGVGAAWIFTRSGNTWTQQGSKLVSSDYNVVGGSVYQGYSVSISADGNTALVGGYQDNSGLGAAWVFTRSGSTWSQQGSKLVGTGSSGATVNQGYSVSISADGNTAFIGGYKDNSGLGAAWVFTRSGSTWSQQGSKLISSNNNGNSNQGSSVSISADATTLMFGGKNDNASIGAAWVFNVSPAPTISSFVPTSGTIGSVITLNGSNFLGINSVSFGGITASSFVVVNSTTITAVVGSGASGTVSLVSNCGTATLGGFTFTAPGAALDFDGSNDIVNITPAIPYTNDFTLEAWIKTGIDGAVFIWGGPEMNNYVMMAVYFGKLRLTIGDGASLQYIDGATTLANSLWTHIAVSKSGSSVKLYVNGNLDFSATSSIISTPSSASIGAGLLNNMIQSFFKGQIDEVRVWNRGLCQAEIQNNRNCDVIANQAGLIAQYSFNQGNASASNPAVTSLIDKSGNGYSGTLTSFALTSTVSNWVFPGGVLSGATCAGYATNTATITSFSPIGGGTGNEITLTGINFTGVTAVYFGGKPALSFTVVSPTKITAIVGTGNSGAIAINPICGAATIGGFIFGRPFLSTWKTTAPGVSIIIPTNGGGYNYMVDWGDGNIDPGNTGNATHTYGSAGTYQVAIYGSFPRIYFNAYYTPSVASNFISIDQWGDIAWTSMNNAFSGCTNMSYKATDAPDLSSVTDMSGMFSGDTCSFNPTIGTWNTSSVTNMSGMFLDCSSFNQDISTWNTSSVTSMFGMFGSCTLFNQDLLTWNTGSVTNTGYMFYRASNFNGAISSWNTGSVKNMSYMFADAPLFNQNLSTWNTGSVIDMSYMFLAEFGHNSTFNGNISSWNTGSVTNMANMFGGCTLFNQDISTWNTGSVTNMANMFAWCTLFNQDISTWNTGSVTNMYSMFNTALSFNQNLSSWNTGSVTNMGGMFGDATVFNQSLSNWDISNVTDMANMLKNSNLSTANYDSTLISWATKSVKSNVTLGADGLTYCSSYQSRNNLISLNNWTITGDALLSSNCLPSITTTSFASALLCRGGSFTVNYSITGTYYTGNVFTAQLSDASGSFALPTVIGFVTSTTNIGIPVTIPTGLAPGTGYLIRVVSSNTMVTGTPNLTGLIVSNDGGAGTWTWVGGVSPNWFEPCNWDKKCLPDGFSDVAVPGGTTFSPLITAGTASCNKIKVNTSAGGVLKIDSSGGGKINITQ